MSLHEWAIKHRISIEALQELCDSCLFLDGSDIGGKSEAAVSQELRLHAARRGKYLFRNNVGAGKLQNGAFVRWGLANDSTKLNETVKSADLIGLEKTLITQEMVGTFIARFLSVESKKKGWKFSGTKEEVAQVKWATFVNAQGGRAVITNSVDSL